MIYSRSKFIDSPYVLILRPTQWTKNLFCIAAPALVVRSIGFPQWVDVFLVFFAFCGLSSAVYIFNDFCNLQEDKAHPIKRNRPIARGLIRLELGLTLSLLLALVGLLVLWLVGLKPLVIGSGYLLLHILYSLKIRDVPIVELLFLATGFALRVLAGAKAVDISWGWPLLFTTYGISLLLGIGKRKSELVWGPELNLKARPVLKYYTPKTFFFILWLTAFSTILSYIWLMVYHGFPMYHNILSGIVVGCGLLRYIWIILKLDGGERPERLLYSDIGITICLIVWLTIFLHAISR